MRCQSSLFVVLRLHLVIIFQKISMPKNKKPTPRKVTESPEQKDEAMTRQLCALSLYLTDQPKQNPTTDQNRIDFFKLIKKCLHQKNDDVLYDTLDRLKFDGGAAQNFFKTSVEELAEVVVIQRDGVAPVEINAFVIPLFLHTTGGLKAASAFQDQQAFEQLTESLQQSGLESPDAKVVLVNHAYRLDDIDSITFSHLHEMVRDAHAAINDMRAATATAITRSFGEPVDEPFAADDVAVELRFLLGFAMKSVDDPFYQIPTDEAAMDGYFAARESRFQAWSQQVAPLVQRCFGPAEQAIEVHFLYQDLFFGGKERGIGEYFTLQLMSELNFGLTQHAMTAAQSRAVIGPTQIGDEKVMRVNLYAIHDGALLASAEKPVAPTADWAGEVLDIRDALGMIGIEAISEVAQFDDERADSEAQQ